MSNKPIIDAIVIVEGKTDTIKLKSLFEVETIETDGFRCRKEIINLIKNVAKHKKIIIFTDPDLVGEKIRKILCENLDEFDQCFITKKDMVKNSKKIGIAEAKPEALIEALKNSFTYNKFSKSISWEQYIDLELINNKAKRINLCKRLKISYSNNKQLFKRLNMLNLSLNEIKKILNDNE